MKKINGKPNNFNILYFNTPPDINNNHNVLERHNYA